MNSSPKKFPLDPYADTFYVGISKLNLWLEFEPERILKANDLDFSDCELMESLYRLVSDDAEEEVKTMASNAFYLATTRFYISTCFGMAYNMQKYLVAELEKLPTSEGEQTIADIRESLAELQEIFVNSEAYTVARSFAALQGDASFVTGIDLTTPKWNKPADISDLNNVEDEK